MLTVNADHHAVMNRMHALGREKHSIVIVPRDRRQGWLSCKAPEEARNYLGFYTADRMDAEAAPRPARGKVVESKANDRDQ